MLRWKSRFELQSMKVVGLVQVMGTWGYKTCLLTRCMGGGVHQDNGWCVWHKRKRLQQKRVSSFTWILSGEGAPCGSLNGCTLLESREINVAAWLCANIQALTSAIVSTLILKCSFVPLPNRPAASPHILTEAFLLETDYEPKHFCSGLSLVHNANDSYATLLFSFFPLSTFPLIGEITRKEQVYWLILRSRQERQPPPQALHRLKAFGHAHHQAQLFVSVRRCLVSILGSG